MQNPIQKIRQMSIIFENQAVLSEKLKTLLGRKRVQNFSKKLLNSMVVGARQSFQFFRQIAWFL